MEGWSCFWTESRCFNLGGTKTRSLVNINSESNSTVGVVFRTDSGTRDYWDGIGKWISERSFALFIGQSGRVPRCHGSARNNISEHRELPYYAIRVSESIG